MRQATIYNKVVNISEDGEISVLADVFEYEDGFRGATGNSFYPVSKAEYEEKITEENFIEYLIDSGIELPVEYKRTGFAGMVAQMNENERANLMFDNSYSELWDMMREVAGLSEQDAYIFNCSGGGRMFDSNFQGNINPELSAIIREYETK